MELKRYEHILSEPLAFWAASIDKNNVPDIVRSLGLAPLEDYDNITFYIPERYSETFINNLYVNAPISFLCCALFDYESYQYKGVFKSMRSCTGAEVQSQQKYLDDFTDLIVQLGYSKEGFYNSYYHQPSLAITFRVQEIFEQTPRRGTGSLLETKQTANGHS
jgi:hypothetical protein